MILGSGRGKRRILCVGAHCDDIEIGCGGALLVLQRRRPDLIIDWVVLSGTAERREETRRAMALLVRRVHRGRLIFGDFADGRFPASYGGIKDFFASLARLRRPDAIFCHELHDLHQDHRVVNEMVWTGFRDHLILEYEIPKWDGNEARPNLYVPISGSEAKTKIDTLTRAYRSQRHRDWFSRDTFLATLRLRGMECRSPSGLAEGFGARKLRLGGL